MSDTGLAVHIGNFVKHHRLEQNQSQDALAQAAGISRSTLSMLERGGAVTLGSLLQVLRALDQLQVMDVFALPTTISPLALAKMERKARKRASGSKSSGAKDSDW